MEKDMIVTCVISLVVLYFVIRWLFSLPSVGHFDDKYVFITGCDTGFGNLLAKRLDNLGFHVFAGCYTSKGADDLQKTSSKRLITISNLDVAKEESIENAHRLVVDYLPSGKGLWAIVNNAGIGGSRIMGPLEWHKRRIYLDVFAVNLLGVIDVTRIFLPLVRKGRGRIVNMSSIAGRSSMPGIGPYCVSKFGVEGFSDCLRRELYKEGISVHILEPGGFRTAFIDNLKVREDTKTAFLNTSPDVQSFYGKHYTDKCSESLDLLIKYTVSEDVHLVIDCYEHAIAARFPRDRYVPGNWITMVILAVTYLPSWMSDWLISGNVVLPEGK